MPAVDAAASLPTYPRTAWSRTVAKSLRENSPLILYAVLVTPVPYLVAQAYRIPVLPFTNLLDSFGGFLVFSAAALFCALAIWYVYHRRILRTPGFDKTAWRMVRAQYLSRERVMLALPLLLLWPILGTGFSYLKSVIPLVQPFYLDADLAAWDRLLHFGQDPWRLLAPLLGYAPVTFLVNAIYMLWLLVFHTVLMLQFGAMQDRKRRLQFLLTMALAWTFVGNLAATLMSSAGPCYYAMILPGEPNPFAPLMAYLKEVSLHYPLANLALQDILWQSQVDGDYGIAKGISASPSMHVASSWIIARLAWSMGRVARIAGSAFLLMIFLGSIHLGWHYAVDGYIGILLAWILWRLVGWILNIPAIARLLWPEQRPEAPSR